MRSNDRRRKSLTNWRLRLFSIATTRSGLDIIGRDHPSIDHRDLDIDHWIPCENAALHGLFDTSFDRRDILLWDRTSDSLVLKRVADTSLLRFDQKLAA